MADDNTQATGGTNTTPTGEDSNQTAAAAQSGQQPTPRTFTQEEVNAIVERRVARVKATPPADYDELKAKAARLDELEEAGKSELEKATAKLQKAQESAADWKARFEELQAAQERAEQVRAMASQYGVDAEMLSRMTGDVEENAKYLRGRADAVPKFGDMTDGGEQPQAVMTEAEIDKIKDPVTRIRKRAEYIAAHKG